MYILVQRRYGSNTLDSFNNAFWTLFLIYANTPYVCVVLSSHLADSDPPPTWISRYLLPVTCLSLSLSLSFSFSLSLFL